MTVICQTCNGRVFASFDALHRHMHDSKKAHHFCQLCSRDFSSRPALVEHSSMQHPDTTCSAPTCNRIFANENALLRHFFDSPKHPKCRACGVGFRSVKDLNIHKRETHGATGRRKQNRPFSPSYMDSMSPHSPSSPHWSLALSRSETGSLSRPTSARETLQGQSAEDILDVSFRSMFSSTPEVENLPQTRNQTEFDGPRTDGNTSPENEYEEGTVSPARSRTSSRSRRSQTGRSSQSSSRSRSPRNVLGETPPPSSSSSIRTSPYHTNIPLQLTLNEKTTDGSTSEELGFYPPGLDHGSWPRVPHYDSIVVKREEQPASPFDANFLNQFHIQDRISSPLLETASVIATDAPADILFSEDEFKILTTTNQQTRKGTGSRLASESDASKDAKSSPSRGSGLKTVLSRSVSRNNAEKTSSLRMSTLSTLVTTPTASSLVPNSVIRPSSLLARLSRGKEASSSISSGMLPSPIHLPIRRPEIRRRLSLSPSLPPIPESIIREPSSRPLSRTESDSDRESLGIFELNAHDLLFGSSLSEDEDGDKEAGCSPPTSVAPTDVECEELGEHEEQRQDDFEEDNADMSDGSCSSPPPLIIEELNRMVREMCLPSPEDEDPFADPISVNNSPGDLRSLDPNDMPLPSGKTSSHESSYSLATASNETVFSSSTLSRSEEKDDTVGYKERADTPTSDPGVQVLFDEARSPFTAPEDVNAEDVYLTPDEMDDESPNRSATRVSACDERPRSDDTPFIQMTEVNTQLDEGFDLSLDSELTQDNDTQFIEENHPLGNLITLDSPMVATPWQHTLAPLSPPPSPGHNEQHGLTHGVQALDLFTQPTSSLSSPGRTPSRGTDQEIRPVRMHCRLCMLDSCEDATATFCGHVFCYRCITREVVEKAACPVCHTPTLLYCLFRLDLSA